METRIMSKQLTQTVSLGYYNSTRLHSMDILSGKEYRRLRRKNKNYKNKL